MDSKFDKGYIGCNRVHGKTTFHLTQMMSGHGCFGKYLHRIQKEPSSQCHHCKAVEHDVSHTMSVYPCWSKECCHVMVVRGSFDVDSLAGRMVVRKECWEAVITFATRVLQAKEDHERTRRGENLRADKIVLIR